MRTSPLMLVAVALSLTISGCVFMNDEDKEFYGKGWVHPTELDQVAPHRDPLGADPRTAAASSAPATQPAPEWIVPETSANNR